MRVSIRVTNNFGHGRAGKGAWSWPWQGRGRGRPKFRINSECLNWMLHNRQSNVRINTDSGTTSNWTTAHKYKQSLCACAQIAIVGYWDKRLHLLSNNKPSRSTVSLGSICCAVNATLVLRTVTEIMTVSFQWFMSHYLWPRPIAFCENLTPVTSFIAGQT